MTHEVQISGPCQRLEMMSKLKTHVFQMFRKEDKYSVGMKC